MKKMMSVLCVLVLFGAAVFAESTDVKVGALNATIYSDATGRFGMQNMSVDKNSAASIAILGVLKGDITADQLATAQKVQANGALVGAYVSAATTYGGAPTAANLALLTDSITNLNNAGITTADITTAQTVGAYTADPTKNTALFVGLKNESSVKVGTKLASDDGKFTADIAAKLDFSGVSVSSAWVAYDLGPVAVKYNSNGSCGRWDSDIQYIGDDALVQNSLDFTIKPVANIGYAFFTVMSDVAVTSDVKYENSAFRTIPMMQLGYVYTADLGDMGSVEATLGGALDIYAKTGADYMGYMGFGGAKWTKGSMAKETGSMIVSLTGVFGQNTSKLAGVYSTDMEGATLLGGSVSKVGTLNSYVGGGRLVAAATLWTGGVVSVDGRMSQILMGGETKNLSSYKVGGGITQFFSSNFNVTLGGGWENYSITAGDVGCTPASGYEIMLQAGFMF